MKVVVNKCYGGFGLSHEALFKYAERKGLTLCAYDRDWENDTSRDYFNRVDVSDANPHRSPIYVTKDVGERLHNDEFNLAIKDCYFSIHDFDRSDPDLVWVVENMGEKVNSRYSSLAIVEIPNDVEFEIEEYDGNEWVAEVHRTWS